MKWRCRNVGHETLPDLRFAGITNEISYENHV